MSRRHSATSEKRTVDDQDRAASQLENQDESADAMDGAVDQQSAVDAQQDTLAQNLSEELAAANDRLLRLQAEMQNLRNRTSREIADTQRYAAMPVVRDLLSVLDNMDRAIQAAETAGEAENLLEGFRLVRQQLATILSQHQCTPIEAEGQPFNPDYHEAILQQPSEEHPRGTVMMVTQKGYQLHDRVVRPSQVIVSSGPPSSD